MQFLGSPRDLGNVSTGEKEVLVRPLRARSFWLSTGWGENTFCWRPAGLDLQVQRDVLNDFPEGVFFESSGMSPGILAGT
jgi:hypothetical protein